MWTPLMVGCSWAQYLAVIGFFGWNSKLQYFTDLYHDHPQRMFVGEPEIQAMLWDLRGSIKRWFPRAKRMSRDQTTLHGDFHRGNIFYHKPTLDATGALGVADLVAIDWAMFGSGHVAHELVYFFNTSVDRQRAVDVTPEAALAEERRLIEMYHAELLRCNPSLVGEYSLEQLLDEVKMVWASYLIGMLLDEDSKAEQRAQDAVSRQGPDLTKPRVDGFGNASVKAAGALNTDLGLRRLIDRFLVYYRDRDSWGDFFDGMHPPPVRSAEAAASARAKAKADFGRALNKLQAENGRDTMQPSQTKAKSP